MNRVPKSDTTERHKHNYMENLFLTLVLNLRSWRDSLGLILSKLTLLIISKISSKEPYVTQNLGRLINYAIQY